jgi:hypothetical protein
MQPAPSTPHPAPLWRPVHPAHPGSQHSAKGVSKCQVPTCSPHRSRTGTLARAVAVRSHRLRQALRNAAAAAASAAPGASGQRPAGSQHAAGSRHTAASRQQPAITTSLLASWHGYPRADAPWAWRPYPAGRRKLRASGTPPLRTWPRAVKPFRRHSAYSARRNTNEIC